MRHIHIWLYYQLHLWTEAPVQENQTWIRLHFHFRQYIFSDSLLCHIHRALFQNLYYSLL